MIVQVRFFAAHREQLGTDRLAVDLASGGRVDDLVQAIASRFPEFEPLAGSARFAVNREYASRSTVLRDGDEVAVIPPVAGGRS